MHVRLHGTGASGTGLSSASLDYLHRFLTCIVPCGSPQAHALTCSKAKGSFGHHFKVVDGSVDSLAPPLHDAIASLHRFEWVGVTDLFEASLCLLHYQAVDHDRYKCDRYYCHPAVYHS